MAIRFDLPETLVEPAKSSKKGSRNLSHLFHPGPIYHSDGIPLPSVYDCYRPGSGVEGPLSSRRLSVLIAGRSTNQVSNLRGAITDLANCPCAREDTPALSPATSRHHRASLRLGQTLLRPGDRPLAWHQAEVANALTDWQTQEPTPSLGIGSSTIQVAQADYPKPNEQSARRATRLVHFCRRRDGLIVRRQSVPAVLNRGDRLERDFAQGCIVWGKRVAEVEVGGAV